MNRDKGQARWQAIWRTRNAVSRLLWPLSLLYGLLTRWHRWTFSAGLRKKERLPVPVIVVGNVVVGGAGKTPTVLALLQHLQDRGWHPGVISRGYGRRGDGVVAVRAETPAHESGDEPALIARKSGVPVFVATQRAAAGRALLAAHPEIDILVCDDGLQHLPLERDLSIVVFDERGTGNGWLLPAGLLREPWPPARNARPAPDLLLLQGRKPVGQALTPSLSGVAIPSTSHAFRAQRRLGDQLLGALGHSQPLSSLQNQPVSALAGIARPFAFFEMLEERGLQLADQCALPDHADDAAYVEALKGLGSTVVCTEKDAVKLWDHPELAHTVWAATLELDIDPDFFAAVDHALATRQPRV